MRLRSLLFLILVPTLITGCGGGDPGNNAGGAAVSKQSASQGCLSCHGSDRTPGTGALVVEEWRASVHNTHNAAGCADCHDPDSGHPQACSKCHGGGAGAVTRNPDQAGKCGKCHGLQFPNDVMLALAPQHFGNMTASAANTKYRASFVSSRYVGNCRACHNPHDPSTAMTHARQWAQSPHGNTTAGAYASSDFKTRGTNAPAATTFDAYCVRCHTTTGFINFVNSGFSDVHAWGDASDMTKQVTGCNACHDNGNGASYSYHVRQVPAVTIYYTYSSAKTFPTVKLNNNPTLYPDTGLSNVCLPCHTGRGIGQQIKDAALAGLNFANANSPGAHYRAAGGTLFQKNGYEFDGRSYVSSGSVVHSAVGLGNVRGTGSKGPCIVCHMENTSHLFLPVTLDATKTITGIVSTVCGKCHDGSLQPNLTAASLQSSKSGFAASLALLNLVKGQKAINNNWDSFSPGNGANTMGASFNYSLLTSDTGAFAHNPLYTKRLIYDSIDWISNGSMDDDVVAAINAAVLPAKISNPITKVAYTSTEIAQLKALAISYLQKSGGGRP